MFFNSTGISSSLMGHKMVPILDPKWKTGMTRKHLIQWNSNPHMPFLQAMVATVEKPRRPCGLLFLNDQNHISCRPGPKSTRLLADKNY